ncbi:hypothetical protein LBMAG42_19180 [Deltaproteobacteria bacterium]|nr:hypothetical protein LBMAG42_19180 [Deltaproteobacteria bacterium]
MLAAALAIGAAHAKNPERRKGARRPEPTVAAEAGQGAASEPPARPATGVRRGNMLLRQGYFRMAVAAFEEAVAASPESPEAHLGLGTAKARLGTCAPALEEFRGWSDSIAFGARVALLAAHCAGRQSHPEEAVSFTLSALEKRPDNRTALARLALDADQLGDAVLRDVAIEYLWYASPDQDESLFAEAALALRHGDLAEFDRYDAMWRREGRASEEMNRMRARSWLDVGDPVEAYVELRKGGSKLKRGADSRLMMSETARRLGQLVDASRALHGRLQGKLSGADADAVQARILVDSGDLEGAAALLKGYELEVDEEMVASRWYLARALGREEEMAAAEVAFAASRMSPLRTLEQYIPLTQRR